jgi:serine/threonine protein kinase
LLPLFEDHPFIQKQLAVHRHENFYILVRELVEGRTLQEYIKFNGFKESVIQQAFEDTLQALNYLHKRNICHGYNRSS